MAYTISGGGFSSTLDGIADYLDNQISDLRPILLATAKNVILPELARQYYRAGIKIKSGDLFDAITKANAPGNIIEVTDNSITVGVDTGQITYASYVLNGRREVLPIRAKVLRWYDDGGRPIFRRRAGPAKPRPVYYTTQGMLDAAADYITKQILAGALGS